MYIRIIMGALLVLLTTSAVTACEVCGGGGGSLQLGIYPQFDRHFIGLRYQYRAFDTNHGSADLRASTGEVYHTADMWLRLSLGERWQVYASLPYRYSTKTETYGTFTTSGLGDVSVFALYALVDNRKWGRCTHTLQVGGGAKLPTGKSDYVTSFDEWFPGLQNGSGSWDALLNANYIVRLDDWGLSLEESFQWSGSNRRQDFRFGNRSTTTLRLFRTITNAGGSRSVIPHVGVSLQFTPTDTYQGEPYIPSGGQVFTAQLGVDILVPEWSFGVSANPIIYQNQADGLIASTAHLTAQAIHFF